MRKRIDLLSTSTAAEGSTGTPDRPLSIAEAAAETGLSRQTMVRLFERERGVIIIDRPETMHKRGHRTIRIPRNVFERVVRGLTIR